MKRYLFEYKVLSSGRKGEYSIVSASKDEAKAGITDKVADIEFTEPSDIKIGELLKEMDAKDNYFECEGCT